MLIHFKFHYKENKNEEQKHLAKFVLTRYFNGSSRRSRFSLKLQLFLQKVSFEGVNFKFFNLKMSLSKRFWVIY